MFFTKGTGDAIQTRSNTRIKTKFNIEGQLFFLSENKSDTISMIRVEIADDMYQQSRGLMYRYHMPDSIGMLFIYEDLHHMSFWMKDTHISLDIIFADENGKIVQIHEYAIPYSEDHIPSKYKAKYAVEVNAGYTERHQIEVDDFIGFQVFN